MIEVLFRTLGPWGLALGIMAWLLKVMVADKLRGIQDTLSTLVEGHSEHAERIVRMETVMGLNGCETANVCPPFQRRRATDG